MNGGNFAGRSGSRRGIVGLFLLLVLGIAAMALLFTMYTGGLNPFAPFQGTVKDRYSDPCALPWEEDHLFINPRLDGYDMGGRRPPFRGQPKLGDGMAFEAPVYKGNKLFGQIELTISKDGDARATWSGEFEIDGKQYKAVIRPKNRDGTPARNIFLGNVAPLKIYEDEKGRDRSKLYVITAGSYELEGPTVADLAQGGAWVTGWIDKRYNARGNLSFWPFTDGTKVIMEWGPVKKTSE